MAETDISGYRFDDAACNCAHDYLLTTIEGVLREIDPQPRRAFDLGCGNGSVADWLRKKGYAVAGVDPSTSGIAEANRAYPDLDLRVGSAYDPLHETFGRYPLVVSLEVVEHVYAPRDFTRCVRDLLVPGGHALISTPYHGYLKNLLLALTGGMDRHFTALWDHGHIKFWSPATITQLLGEVGLSVLRVHRVGRLAPLAKSMLVVARRDS
jgi:2-polyprenyl-6-hydroxyphenyl methylase/3-demethylubiquinone-9 3-methyltransferase